MAQKLAERLPFLKEVEEAQEEDQQENDASPDVTELRQEFNQQVTNLLFASSEVEQELEVAQAINESQAPVDSALSELDQARERFINELSQLKEDEDPTPYLENFIPALLPALKLGLRLVGRKRVVSLLARPLAKLIRRFIGPQYSPALSRALVDVGLRLMRLEVTSEDEARAAPVAVAATVEDTVRQVAALPEYVLDNPELLEGYTLEAFEQAAAVNLPPVLPEAVYREHPDLLEAEGVKGCWIPMPLRGPKRYKKFSRIFKVVVTPHKAMVVQTFGETMLADYLQDQLGLPSGASVEAEVHLYESLPGTTLPELARLEEATPGLGSSAEQATVQLHPLTPEAAGLLLGEPGLGRPSSPRYLSNRRTIGVGQRFYHLAIPGRRPLMMAEPRGRARLRRPYSLRIVFHFPTDQIRVHLFLSESKAQELAGRLRKQGHQGIIVKNLHRLFKLRLPAIISGRLQGPVKIIHETLTPQQALGGGLWRLPNATLWTLSKKLQEWLIGSEDVRNFFKLHAQRIIAATEDPKDGITLTFTVFNPPGFPQLRQVLRGKNSAISGLNWQGGAPKVRVDVVPGYRHG